MTTTSSSDLVTNNQLSSLDTVTLFTHFSVDSSQGYSQIEIPVLLEKYGPNTLVESKTISGFKIFLAQFHNVLIYVLLAAVVITLFLGQYVDSIIIFIVILLNAALSTFQEMKAHDAVAALKKLSSPVALVRRDGKVQEIALADLVPGDIVLLDTGDYVPADIKLLNTQLFKVDESLLTGESLTVTKDANFIPDETTSMGDRKDLVYRSTLVSYGRATGIVIATGMDTEIGKIAQSLDSQEQLQTPLEIKMEDLGKKLGFLAVIISLLMFGIGALQGRNLAELFLTSVSLAVAAIPEGLAAIVAIVLSLGVTKMSKKNAIIRKLYSVETLGSVNIICSDKTGTLTQNKMTVVHYATADTSGKIIRSGNNQVSDTVCFLAEGMVFASNAGYLDNGERYGDPTETALLVFAEDLQLDPQILLSDRPHVAEHPFDSERKMMSTLIQEGTQYQVYSKGAVDQLLKVSNQVFLDGEEVPLTPELREELIAQMEQLSNQALRVLGLAYKESDHLIAIEEMESDLTFVGMVGMIDPPREEAKTAIQLAAGAGIQTIMITGDHPNTAFAIAKKLGILQNPEQVLTGQMLDQLSDSELFEQVHQYQVFARVSPQHKVRIVQALQAHAAVVAMTGDGVNDAPSLNAANVGIAMGVSGTDVAKGAAEIILADDNFSTIVSAVAAGRNIYSNIKKSINFLLSCNLGEIITVLVAILSGWAAPLSATQLLWINLITDSLPAVALGLDPDDPEIMKKAPRDNKKSFFSQKTIFKDIFGGVLIGGITLLAFFWGYYEHGYLPLSKNVPSEVLSYARTMAFLVLVSAQLFYAFALRHSKKSIFTLGWTSNIYLLGALFVGILLQVLLISIPFVQELFHLQMLSVRDFIIVIIMGIVPLMMSEVWKWIERKKSQKRVI